MEQFAFPFYTTDTGGLPLEIQALLQAAKHIAGDAYAPYSNFKVGAAALFANGGIKSGANHENASYPAGTCAERGLLSGINPLDKNQQIKAIAVTYLNENDPGTPISPCGICRQTILEQQLAQHSPIAVYMSCPGGDVLYVADASHLLPFYFSSKNLKL